MTGVRIRGAQRALECILQVRTRELPRSRNQLLFQVKPGRLGVKRERRVQLCAQKFGDRARARGACMVVGRASAQLLW